MTIEQLKEKLALEEENRLRKIQGLKSLDTTKLVAMLPDLEQKLEGTLRAEASFRDLNIGYLSSSNQDCAEVKRITAELSLRCPEMIDGKKTTVDDRKAWLELQRTQNNELANALGRQKTVAFNLDGSRIDIEMAKKRLETVYRVLALRTAQIQFLTEHNF